ncbi:G protein coupled receptor [Rhizoctonia solani AG-3 Rhs1AP]|uniref:G protein coupled receptor n=1 Tax=Rhizoctonia solani AG-3 Rhs1AP TaxID=1086054 RepID=X8J545_9AGAM|nr:G protein coupled receptor [Rhizoctonia solani AG-3 Rhs1AP]
MESDLSAPRSYLAYQTALFFVVRGALFYICRVYLIRSLYKLSSITQSNSAALTPGSPLTTPTTPRSSSRVGDSYFELGNLPVPNVTRSHPRGSVARWGLGPTSVARSAFALCFSESCSLFLLVMCQAYDIMSPTSRYVNWRISLMTLVVLILVVIPVLQCLFVAYRPGKFDIGVSLSRRLALPLFFFSAYALLLLRIPLVGNNKDMDTLTAALMRLSVLGTVVLGTLSGFGAITTAWMFAGALGKKRWEGITKQDIASAEHSLTRVRNDLDLRNRESQALELQNTKNPQPRSWGSRFLGAFSGESEATALRREIAGLRALEVEMSRELEHMRAQQARIEFSKTFGGRIWNVGGWLFGAYCVFRVVNSATNLLFLSLGFRQYPTFTPSDTCTPSPGASCTGISTAPPDLISGALGLLVSLVPGIPLERSEADQVARQISLLLVGCIVLSSIRVVLIGVGKILRVTSQSVLTSLALLILAQLMGTYLLSTLIQLRTSFPPSYAEGDGSSTTSSLFSTLPTFEVFGWIFDATFLLSACITMVGRWLEGRLQ